MIPIKGQIVPPEQITIICEHYGRHRLLARMREKWPARPFSSDGCSAWPDRWLVTSIDSMQEIDFYEDCFLHDLEYWCGGSEADRLEADCLLATGVGRKLEAAGHNSVGLADMMWRGVRLGGADILKTPWRWGFGHD